MYSEPKNACGRLSTCSRVLTWVYYYFLYYYYIFLTFRHPVLAFSPPSRFGVVRFYTRRSSSSSFSSISSSFLPLPDINARYRCQISSPEMPDINVRCPRTSPPERYPLPGAQGHDLHPKTSPGLLCGEPQDITRCMVAQDVYKQRM